MVEYERFSLNDPIGQVFYDNEEVYRGIREGEVEHVLEMFKCGLIDELNDAEIIPFTEIAEIKMDEFPLVLHHERIQNHAYMQEWSFSMIKDAALLILKLEKHLLKYGYNLKDCHGYNVMFRQGKPVYVDIGSFVKYTKAGYAIREFYAYYDQILQMFSCVPSIARERLLSRCNIGVRYNLYYLEGVYHGDLKFQKIDNRINEISEITHMVELIKIIEEEEKVINGYEMINSSEWEDYQNGYTDVIQKIDYDQNIRFKRIVQLCSDLNVTSILELAANQGVLSRMLATIPTINNIYATDYDEGAVDKLFNYLKGNDVSVFARKKIYPMVYDVTTEFVPDISLRTFSERTCSDAVIVCALMHHLILAQHINIDSIFDKLYKLTKQYLIIEFMPLGLWDGGELPPIPSWYTERWFIDHMERRFRVLSREDLLTNRVLFVAERID